MLARAELGLLLPLMVLPVALMLKALPFTRQLLLFLLTCVVSLAVVSPWLIANLTRFDEPVLFSTNDGLTLCGANLHRTWYGEGTGVWALDCAGFPVRRVTARWCRTRCASDGPRLHRRPPRRGSPWSSRCARRACGACTRRGSWRTTT